MEDIEYLEEFKDMVRTSIAPSTARNANDVKARGKGLPLPSKANYSDDEDSSSSDIDIDIFEKLFNNDSDGDIAKNSDKKKNKPKPANDSKTNVRVGHTASFSSSDYDSDDSVYNILHIDKSKNQKRRPKVRDSIDSIDALVEDFGERISDRGRKPQQASRATASGAKKSSGGSTTTASCSKPKPTKPALSAIKGRPPISSNKKTILQSATSTSTPKTLANKSMVAEKLVPSGQKTTLAYKTHKSTITPKQQITSHKFFTTHKLTPTQKPAIKGQKSVTMTQKAISNQKSATKTSTTPKPTLMNHAKQTHSSQILGNDKYKLVQRQKSSVTAATSSSLKSASPTRGNSNILGRRTFLNAKDLATPKQPGPNKDPLNLDENDYKDDTDEDDFLSLPDDDDGGLSGIDSDSFISSDYTHDSDDEHVIDISTDSNFSGARSELRSTPPPNVSDSDETTSDKFNERLQIFLDDISVFSKCKTLEEHGSDCSLDSIERSLEAKYTSQSKASSKCDLTKDTTDKAISDKETNENKNIKPPQLTDDKPSSTAVVIEECVPVETNEKQVRTDVEKDNKMEQNQQTATVSVENPTPPFKSLNDIKSSPKPTAESTPLLTSSSRSLITTNKPPSTQQKDLSEVDTLSIKRSLYKDNDDNSENANIHHIENVMDDFDESITLEQIEQSSLELQKQIMEMDNDLELSLDFDRRQSTNSRCSSLKSSYIKPAKNSPQKGQTPQQRGRGRPKKNRAKTTDEPKSLLIEKTVKIRTVSDSALSNLEHRCFDNYPLIQLINEYSTETKIESKMENINQSKIENMTENSNELDVANKVLSKTVETIAASHTNNDTDTSHQAKIVIEGSHQLASEWDVQQRKGTSTTSENLLTTAKGVASSNSDNVAKKQSQCDLVNEKPIAMNLDLLKDEKAKKDVAKLSERSVDKKSNNADQSPTDILRKEKSLHTQHKHNSENPKEPLHEGEEQITKYSNTDIEGAATLEIVCMQDMKSNAKSQLPSELFIEETCVRKSKKEISNKSVLQNDTNLQKNNFNDLEDMTLLKEDFEKRVTKSTESKEHKFQIPREMKPNETSYKSHSREGSTTPKRESIDSGCQIRDLISCRSNSNDSKSADTQSQNKTSKKHKEKRHKSSSKERDHSHEKRKSEKKDRCKDCSKMPSKATEISSGIKITESSPKKDKAELDKRRDEKRERNHDSSHLKERDHSKDRRKSHRKDNEKKTTDKKDTETKKKDVNDPKTETKSSSENEKLEDKNKTKESELMKKERYTEVTVKPSSSKTVESRMDKHNKKEKKHLKDKHKESNSRSDKSNTKLSEKKVTETKKPNEIFKEKKLENANKSMVDKKSVKKLRVTKEPILNEKTLSSQKGPLNNLLEISTYSQETSLVDEIDNNVNLIINDKIAKKVNEATTKMNVEATVISTSSLNDPVFTSKAEVNVVDKKLETNDKEKVLTDKEIIKKRLSTSKEQEIEDDSPENISKEGLAKEIKPSVENYVVDQTTNSTNDIKEHLTVRRSQRTEYKTKETSASSKMQHTVTEKTQQAVTLTLPNETESRAEICFANEKITNIESNKNSKSQINSEKTNNTSEEEVLEKYIAKDSVCLTTPQEELCNRLNTTQSSENVYASVIIDSPLTPSSSKRCEHITVNNSFIVTRETRRTLGREDSTTTGTSASSKERTENAYTVDLPENLMSRDSTSKLKRDEAKNLDGESTECIVKSARKKMFIQNTKSRDSPAMKLTRSATKNLAEDLEEESQTKELAAKSGRKKDLIENTKDSVSPVNTKLTRSVARNLTEELKNEERKSESKESVEDAERGKERDNSVRKLTRSATKNLIDGGLPEEIDSKESLATATITKDFTECTLSRDSPSTKLTRSATRNLVNVIKIDLAESGSECNKDRKSPATTLTRSAIKNLADGIPKLSAESDSKESTVMCERRMEDLVGSVQQTDSHARMFTCSMKEENDSKETDAKSVRNKFLPESIKPRVSPVTMLTRSAASNLVDGFQIAMDGSDMTGECDQNKDLSKNITMSDSSSSMLSRNYDRMADDKGILLKSAAETLQKSDQSEKSKTRDSPRMKFTRSATRNLTEILKVETEVVELEDSCAEHAKISSLIPNIKGLDSPTTKLTRSAVKNLSDNLKLETEKSDANVSGNERGKKVKSIRSKDSRKGLFECTTAMNECQNYTDTDTEEEGRSKVTRMKHIEKRKRRVSPEVEPLAKIVRIRRDRNKSEQEKESMSVSCMSSSSEIVNLAPISSSNDKTTKTENVQNSQTFMNFVSIPSKNQETCNGGVDTSIATKESFDADSKNIDVATSVISTPTNLSTVTEKTSNVSVITITAFDSNVQCDKQVSAMSLELANQVASNDQQFNCENISPDTQEHTLYEHLPESSTPIEDLLPVYDEGMLPCDDMVIEQFIEVEFSQMANINDESQFRHVSNEQDVDEVANQLADILNSDVINTGNERNEDDLGVEITDEELINGLIGFAMPEHVQTTNDRINIVDNAALDTLLSLEQTEMNEKSAELHVVVERVGEHIGDSEKKQVDYKEKMEDNKVSKNQDSIYEDKRISIDEIKKTAYSINKIYKVKEPCATLKNLDDLQEANDNEGSTLKTTIAVDEAETTAINMPEEPVLACIYNADEISILNENYKDTEITYSFTDKMQTKSAVIISNQNENSVSVTQTSDSDAKAEVENEATSVTKTSVVTLEESNDGQVERSPSVTSEYVRKLRVRLKRTNPQNIVNTKKTSSDTANTESFAKRTAATTAILTNVDDKQQAKDGDSMLITSKRSLRKRVAKTTTKTSDENEAIRRRLLGDSKVILKHGCDKMLAQKTLVGKATYLDRFEKLSDQPQSNKKPKISNSIITSPTKERAVIVQNLATAIETKSTPDLKTKKPFVKGTTPMDKSDVAKLTEDTLKKIVGNPNETSATPTASRVKKTNQAIIKLTTDELSKDVSATAVPNKRQTSQPTTTKNDSSTDKIDARKKSKERVAATRQMSIAGAKADVSKSHTNTLANKQEATSNSNNSNKPRNVSKERQTTKSVTILSAVGKKVDKVQSNFKTSKSTKIILTSNELSKMTIGDIVDQPSTSKECQSTTKSTNAESMSDTSKDVNKIPLIHTPIKKSSSKDTYTNAVKALVSDVKMKNDETKGLGKKHNTPRESDNNKKNIKLQNETTVEDVVSSTTITTRAKIIETAPTTTQTAPTTRTETAQTTTVETATTTTAESSATTTETAPTTTTETPPTTHIAPKTTIPNKIQTLVTASKAVSSILKSDIERALNNDTTKVIVSTTQTKSVQSDQQSSDVNSKPVLESNVTVKITSQRKVPKERGRKKNPNSNVIPKLITGKAGTKEQRISSSDRENSSVSREPSSERITRRTIKAGSALKLSSRETSHDRFVSSNETEGDGSSVSGSVGGDKRETSKERVTRRSMRAVSITSTAVHSTRKTSHECGLATKLEEPQHITTGATTIVTSKNEPISKATYTVEVVSETVVTPLTMEIDANEEEQKKASVESQIKSGKRKATEPTMTSVNKRPRLIAVIGESEKAVTVIAPQSGSVPVTLTASTKMLSQVWHTAINDKKWQPRIRINRKTFDNFGRRLQQARKQSGLSNPVPIAVEHDAMISEHAIKSTDKNVNEIANISVADLEQVEGHIEQAYQHLSTTNMNVKATLQEKRFTSQIDNTTKTLATTSTSAAPKINSSSCSSSDQIMVGEMTLQPFALIEPKSEVDEEMQHVATTPSLPTVTNVTSTVSTTTVTVMSPTHNTMHIRAGTQSQEPNGSSATQRLLTAVDAMSTPSQLTELNTTTMSSNTANTTAYTIGRTCTYTYLHPAKYNRSYGHVQLDYCCPNLNGPMRAIDPTRLHQEIKAPVRELPACIVMTTKVVKASEYKKNRDILPEPVRLKLERRNGGVSLASVLAAGDGVVRNQTAALPPSAQSMPCVGIIKKILATSMPYSQTSSKKVTTRVQSTPATATTSSTTTVASPVALPTATKVSTIDKLKRQLPTITITPKLRYGAITTTSVTTPAAVLPGKSTAAVNSHLGATHPIQPAMPLFNVDILTVGPQTEQRIDLQRNVQLFDKLLQNIARRVLTLSLQDRQRTIAAIVGNSRLEPIDFEVGMKLLENYDKWITAVTVPQSTTTAPLTTQIQTQSTNASTCILNESTGLFESSSMTATSTALTRTNVALGKLMTPPLSKQQLKAAAAVSTSFGRKSAATSSASDTATHVAKRSHNAVAMYDTNNQLIGYQFNATDTKNTKTTAIATTITNTDTTMSLTVTPAGARIRRGVVLKLSPATTPTGGLPLKKLSVYSNTPQQQPTTTTTSNVSTPANTSAISTTPKPRGRPRALTKVTNSTFQRPNAKLASGVITPMTALAPSSSPASKSTSSASQNVQASSISIATVSSGGNSGAEECILPDAMDTTPLDPSQIKSEQMDEDMII